MFTDSTGLNEVEGATLYMSLRSLCMIRPDHQFSNCNHGACETSLKKTHYGHLGDRYIYHVIISHATHCCFSDQAPLKWKTLHVCKNDKSARCEHKVHLGLCCHRVTAGEKVLRFLTNRVSLIFNKRGFFFFHSVHYG